jgi:hypothetical protein
MGGNGSGELPGPGCPASFRMNENFVEGTEPKTNGSSFYTSCGIRLVAPFGDWQGSYNAWAAGAVSGQYSYGRFSWTICGFAPKPSASPSDPPGIGVPPGRTSPPGGRTPIPTPRDTPKPTKKP